jgi:Amt family ammonium transporter
MSLKTFSRARLLAFAGPILLGLALSAPAFHSSYAQAPAATAPAPAAPAADAGPPACDGVKVTENCTPNSGDTAWMLTSMAIVLMMTVPGLALFYGGMVR